MMPKPRGQKPPSQYATARSFRPQVQWAVDVDYLKRLPPAEREFADQFLREYYDADNKRLRPERHVEKCATCREGGECGKRPKNRALHATDALRRDCYNRQWWASQDVMSRGMASFWDDFDGVNNAGEVTPFRSDRWQGELPRIEAGDTPDSGGNWTGGQVAHVPVRVRAKGKT